jgi:SIR2-like domain
VGGAAEREAPLARDPLVVLALSLAHNKGSYALLLGSGVSRSASIPTGWDIVVDMVRQIAAGLGEHCGPGQEEDWYKEKFGEEPTYDALLGQVTGFKVERASLLAGYIEPTDEDLSEGARVPQLAHHAIARLVRGGYIRVIVTTNFDQLLEDALRAVNVTPRVVATADAVEQSLPLVHQQCTIIKVHGDYTSGELKNTTEELATYDRRLNTLLQRVFSDFGLIVCGWSAEWDSALRAVLGSSASRAYSTFWAARGRVGETASQVLESRNGKAVIQIESADSFFNILEEKVAAIADLMDKDRLSSEIAAATLKRYLSDPYANRVRIDDLVIGEVERLLPWLDDHYIAPPSGIGYFQQERPCLQKASASLVAMFAVGCRWGEQEQHSTWGDALTRILNSSIGRTSMITDWFHFWGYLGALLAYAGGVASIRGGRYDTLGALLEAQVAESRNQRVSVLQVLSDVSLAGNTHEGLFHESRTTPFSNHVRDSLRDALRVAIADDETYADLFDRFEYLLALLQVDASRQRPDGEGWAPLGRFGWDSSQGKPNNIVSRIAAEYAQQGIAWPPLKAGLFGGDLSRLEYAQQRVGKLISQWNWYR